MASGARPFVHVGKLPVTVAQWKMLDLVGPIWEYYKHDVCHVNTRLGLQRRGWITFKYVQGVMMARLTPAGMEIRDMIHKRRSRARAREYGECPEER